MKVGLFVLLGFVISVSQSRFSVDNGILAGVYSGVCGNTKDTEMSENFVAFSPNEIHQVRTNEKREVIISPLNAHALAFGVNLIASLINIGKLNGIFAVGTVEFIFIVYDERTMAMCDDMYLPCWTPRGILALQNHSVVNTFRHRLLAIPDVVHRLLSVGAHVLYTDTDVVWLRSPFDLLHVDKVAPDTIQLARRDIKDMSFFYVHTGPSTVAFFAGLYDICVQQRQVWSVCFEQHLEQRKNIVSFIGEESFGAGGCSWKGLSEEQRNRAYYFHGSCKPKRGLSSILGFYDRNNMLLVKALKADRVSSGASASEVLQRAMEDLRAQAAQVTSLRGFIMAASTLS